MPRKGQRSFWLENGMPNLFGTLNMQDLFPQPWLVNTLLDDGFGFKGLATKRPEYLALVQ